MFGKLRIVSYRIVYRRISGERSDTSSIQSPLLHDPFGQLLNELFSKDTACRYTTVVCKKSPIEW